MRNRWLERLSRWGVVMLGLVLAAWGVAVMWEGWGIIQIERGWSLFIGGAAALAGGSVTLALGAVLQRLDNLAMQSQSTPKPARPREPASPGEPAPGSDSKKKESPLRQADKAATSGEAAARAVPRAKESSAPVVSSEAGKGAVEVDRYVSGETTYVMFSDGSVEVRGSFGAERFASLAELRARAGQQA